MTDPSDEQLAAWLAGDLDEAADAAVLARVSTDPAVAVRADAIAAVMGGLAAAGAPPVPDGFADGLEAGLAAALGLVSLSDAGTAGGGGPATGGAAGGGGPATGGAAAGPTQRPAGRGDTGGPGRGESRLARLSASRRVQRITSGMAVLLLVVSTGGLLVRSLRDGPDSVLPAESPTIVIAPSDRPTEEASGDPSAQPPGSPAGSSSTPSPVPTTSDLPVGPTTAVPGTSPSSSPGAGAPIAPPLPSAPSPVTPNPAPAPAPPAPAPPAPAPAPAPPAPAPPAPAPPPPPAPPPTPVPAPSSADPGPAAPSGSESDDSALAPPTGGGSDSGDQAPEAASPSGGPTIADSMVDLAGASGVRAYFGGRPEVGAVIGLAQDEAAALAAANKQAVEDAGPFSSGSAPASCLGQALSGTQPAVVVVVESVVVDGQAGIAYLVVRGSPNLDRADVLVATADGCQALFSGSVAT